MIVYQIKTGDASFFFKKIKKIKNRTKLLDLYTNYRESYSCVKGKI